MRIVHTMISKTFLRGLGKMRYTSVCFVFLFLFFATMLHAQPETLISAVELVVWDRSKREIVAQHLNVTQAEADAFWRTYERYERTRRFLVQERLRLFATYTQLEMEGGVDDKVDDVTKRLLLNEYDYARVYQDYYKRIKVILTAKRAIQFIQFEKYFKHTLDARLDSLAADAHDMLARKSESD
jgi:hypothetical protein